MNHCREVPIVTGIDILIRRALQAVAVIPVIALITVLAGIILVVAGLIMMATEHRSDSRMRHESKGVVLVGPIPIVWGFGTKAQRIAIAIAFLVFAVYLMLVLM
jgi:uncharacterized protein (TIGR00304 family)